MNSFTRPPGIAKYTEMTKTNEFKNDKHFYGSVEMFIMFKIKRFRNLGVFQISGTSVCEFLNEFFHPAALNHKTTRNYEND